MIQQIVWKYNLNGILLVQGTDDYDFLSVNNPQEANVVL